MSGIYNRLGYDKCAIDQQFEVSIGPGNYALYPGAVVNPSYNSNRSSICNMKPGCKKLEQPKSTIGTGPEYILQRLNIEDNLRGINKINTRCNEGNFNQYTTEQQRDFDNIVVFNPKINERDLFVSNMNVEYEQGFGKNPQN